MSETQTVINLLGREVSGKIPTADIVPGMFELTERDAAIWELAHNQLKTRDNDGHCLYAYGIAKALLSQIPEADENIVLPAILIHDIGWSTVDEREALEAIAPDRDGSRHHLVVKHEKEGARIARDLLAKVGLPEADIEEICSIIDGHDTRLEPISINDAIVKDSDKIWRVTPHGRRVVNDWFGINNQESLRLCAFRSYNELFTTPGKAMSRVLVSIAVIDQSPQVKTLYRPRGAN